MKKLIFFAIPVVLTLTGIIFYDYITENRIIYLFPCEQDCILDGTDITLDTMINFSDTYHSTNKPTVEDMKKFMVWLDTLDSSNCGFIEAEIEIFSGSKDTTRMMFRDSFMEKYAVLCLDQA